MKYVYMTLLGSDSYLKGVISLWECLTKVNSKYSLVVLVTSNVSNKSKYILKKLGLDYILITQITVPDEIIRNNSSVKQKQWSNTFSKLLIFGMTQFDKIVFVDADMYICKNIDDLFERENLSAVAAGRYYPGNSNWVTLNSGLMVIIPKQGEDTRLINLLRFMRSKNGIGDQDVIHTAYPEWPKKNSKHLGQEYNIFALYEAFYVKEFIKHSEIKVIHFTGEMKPWDMSLIQLGFYCIKLMLKQLFLTHSLRGVFSAIKDSICYFKICHKKEIGDLLSKDV